jgi:hypothetical protein
MRWGGFLVVVLTTVACVDDGVSTPTVNEATGGSDAAPPTTETGLEEEDDKTSGTLDLGTTSDDTGHTDDTNDTDPPGPVFDCSVIDYLYVVDNSASMLPHQQTFLDALPAFATTTTASIPTSHASHVMVVKPDEGWGGHCIDECDELGGCLDDVEFDCSSTMQGCDAALGAGVVHPYGLSGANQPCELLGSSRYILPEEPNVLPPLTCMANLGVRFYDMPTIADALLAALAPANLGPGGCNEGFLRDDALLVVTLVTDKNDTVSAGSPHDWYEAVVTAKGGRPENVVVVGLFAEDAAACSEEARSPDDLGLFVDLFPTSFRIDLCTQDIESDLLDTIIPTLEACEAMQH